MKQPAFQFYSQDFLIGVSDLTNEEVGQYIRMLCLQHQKGPLSAKIIKIQVGDVTEDVMQKFEVDEDGLFYNKRLKSEMEKREDYIIRQRENGKMGGRPKTQNKPKENPSLNPNETQALTQTKPKGNPNHNPKKTSSSSLSTSLSLSTSNSKEEEERGKQVSPRVSRFEIPKIEEIEKEFIRKTGNESYGKSAAESFFNFYDSKGWMVGKNKMKKWEAAVGTWITRDRNEGKVRVQDQAREAQPEFHQANGDWFPRERLAEYVRKRGLPYRWEFPNGKEVLVQYTRTEIEKILNQNKK